MFKKLGNNKTIHPKEVLINFNNFNNDITSEVAIYALECLKKKQSKVEIVIQLSSLSKTIFVDTEHLDITQGEKNTWILNFNEYTFHFTTKGILKDPTFFKWVNEKSFRLTFSSHVSDSSHVMVHFYGDINNKNKEDYFIK